MNLINGLNEKKYTLQGLSEHYYAEITRLVKEINEKGKNAEDTFKTYVNEESPLRDISYDEFLEITKLLKQYEEVVANRTSKFGAVIDDKKTIENELKKITNFSLIRRLSQDMKKEDTKSVLRENFLALKELGYNGEQDAAIPEIVRGNFNIYMRNKEKLSDIKILKEAIDRSRLYLLVVDPDSSVGVQQYKIEHILTNKRSIVNVRRELASKGRAPFELHSEKILYEYNAEQYRSISKNMDVWNEKQKTIDRAMDGTIKVDEKTYKRLSDLGYYGNEEHPLIRIGYRMYVDSYVRNKELNYCLDVSKDLCYELRKRYRTISEWSRIRSNRQVDIDCMTDLIMELSCRNKRSKYKRWEISQEQHDKAKTQIEQGDIAMQNEKIFTAIDNVKKVKAVTQRNVPHSR